MYRKEKGKGFYPNGLDLGGNSVHWARLNGRAPLGRPSNSATRAIGRRPRRPRGVRLRCVDAGDVEPASTYQRGLVVGPLTSGPRLQVRPQPPARARRATEEAFDAGRRRYRASPVMIRPPACSAERDEPGRPHHGCLRHRMGAELHPRQTVASGKSGHGLAARRSRKKGAVELLRFWGGVL